jgi:hypothetical protein
LTVTFHEFRDTLRSTILSGDNAVYRITRWSVSRNTWYVTALIT